MKISEFFFIRKFPVLVVKFLAYLIFIMPQSARRLRSDCMHAQGDLSPLGAPLSSVIQSILVLSKSKGLWNASKHPYLDTSDLQY